MEKLYNYMMENGYSEELYNKIEKEVKLLAEEDIKILQSVLDRENVSVVQD